MCKSPLYAYRTKYLIKKDGERVFVWDSKSKKPLLKSFSAGTYIVPCVGGVAPKLSFTTFEDWSEKRNLFPENDYFRLPCGQCIDCRLKYSKEWATRIICESSLWPHNLFVTLTYDDEHLPHSLIDPNLSTIDYSHLTKFIKRLRSRISYDYSHINLRYYACGEYGDKSQRAHFHICFFNVPAKLMEELKYYKASFKGDVYYISDYLQEVWGQGIVVCGELNYQSAAYVARYVCKKLKGEKSAEALSNLGISNQLSRMSLKPGIGYGYYEHFKDEIYKNDELFLPSVGRVCVSRYFDRLLELDDPIFLSELKLKRSLSAEAFLTNKLTQTDLDEINLLKSELIDLENRVKLLVRPSI